MTAMRQNISSSMWRPVAWLTAAVAGAMNAHGVSVSELQQDLTAHTKVTVVDVRSATLFARSHIPGAINIPAVLCPAVKLPPLGKVIVYDEGLGRIAIDKAAASLAAKPGITVDVLTGGFAAWESANGMTSRGRGVRPEILNYITYGQLKVAKASDLVLVDLRKKPSPSMLALRDTGNPAAQPLTDLSTEFPGMKQTQSAFGMKGSPLLVLIDNGDGASEAMARKLKNSGNKRYVILAGGEKILTRHGQPGLERTTLVSLTRKGPAPTGVSTNP